MRCGEVRMSTRYSKAKRQRILKDVKYLSNLSSYPIDMSSFLLLPHGFLDAAGVPYDGSPTGYHPTLIAQYALAHWNQYLATSDQHSRSVFLIQAEWLVEHESRINKDSGGWPISSSPLADYSPRGPHLSALTQGSAISVLLRAYQLTGRDVFLEVACRAVCTFEQDILDGGVSAPVGTDGIFFEEVAAYPATHILSGFIFALFGLYDYVGLTGDAQIEKLISRGIATMHSLLHEFDLGYWTCADLLHRCLASPSHLALQVALLEALAKYSDCDLCSSLASRWKGYQRQFAPRLRYLITSCCAWYGRALWGRVRAALFPRSQASPFLRICVPIAGFPVTGGTRAVLAGVAQVTWDMWHIEYLTQRVGPNPEKLIIHRFGAAKMSPWQFPTVWLYCLAGFRKLISLLRQGAGYSVILPQDGVFTAAFAAVAAKLAGVRVVCIDHGNLTVLASPTYRAERLQGLATKRWPLRLLGPMLFLGYWPSLSLFARLAACFVDHFLIPGLTGDGVEESCIRLGVHPSRITRFASMIDMDRYVLPDTVSRAELRKKNGIVADAIVVAVICRLAPEKGINIALESVSKALSELSPSLRARVRVVIAGDGPLRKQIEEDIRRRGLSETCLLWGEISTADVISLLSFSDIFLYTSMRGACFSMAVLEAMVAGCAVVASTEPRANAHLLAEGRGISVSPGDVVQTSMALVRLFNDMDLCCRMGKLARNYIVVQHSPAQFRRTLMRVTYWSALDKFLNVGMQYEG